LRRPRGVGPISTVPTSLSADTAAPSARRSQRAKNSVEAKSRAKTRKPKTTPKTLAAKDLAWSKPAPIELGAEASVDDAIVAIVRASRTHWENNRAAAVDGRAPEGIHQVRVGLRRFRSALSLFKRFIPDQQRHSLNTEAKWALKQLGAVRDLDVFITELAAPVAENAAHNADVAAVLREARKARHSAHAAVAKALSSTRFGRFNERIDAWLSGRGWSTARSENLRDGSAVKAEDFARRHLNRRLRDIRDQCDGFSKLNTEQRHELRIDVKKVRYGLDFFGSALPAKRVERLAAALKNMQDRLGKLNDLVVAERTVDTLTDNAGADAQTVAKGGAVITRWHKAAAKSAMRHTASLCRKIKKAPSL